MSAANRPRTHRPARGRPRQAVSPAPPPLHPADASSDDVSPDDDGYATASTASVGDSPPRCIIIIIIIIICTLYQTLNSSGWRGAYRYKMISQEHTYHTHRELQTISNASMLARHTTLWGTLSSSAQFTWGITPKLLTIESLEIGDLAW